MKKKIIYIIAAALALAGATAILGSSIAVPEAQACGRRDC